LSEALAKGKTKDNSGRKFLIASFSSDWLYPPYQSLEIVRALQENNFLATYCQIDSSYGHDAFLLEVEELSSILRSFL